MNLVNDGRLARQAYQSIQSLDLDIVVSAISIRTTRQVPADALCPSPPSSIRHLATDEFHEIGHASRRFALLPRERRGRDMRLSVACLKRDHAGQNR